MILSGYDRGRISSNTPSSMEQDELHLLFLVSQFVVSGCQCSTHPTHPPSGTTFPLGYLASVARWPPSFAFALHPQAQPELLLDCEQIL